MKDIRDEVKDALSIRLPEDPKGKHFYKTWFDSLNKIRRIPAHPAGRNYKQDDIETLAIVVDHLASNLPDEFTKDQPNAPIS